MNDPLVNYGSVSDHSLQSIMVIKFSVFLHNKANVFCLTQTSNALVYKMQQVVLAVAWT